MKVLYVNHTGQISGGEKSLLEIVRGAAPAISPIVACPDGALADALGRARRPAGARSQGST